MSTLFTLNIQNILFYLMTILWVMEFIVFKNHHDSESFAEKKSFYLILLSVVVTILVTGFWILLEVPFYQAPPLWVNILGLSVYALGIFIRFYAIYTLGKYFTRHVAVDESHTLIQHGPYKLFRHPAYVGLFLLGIVTPLYFGHIIGLILGVTLMSVTLHKRMVLEEKALEEKNPHYKTWKQKRYRFIPYIY